MAEINNLPTHVSDGQTGHLNSHQVIHAALKEHEARVGETEANIQTTRNTANQALDVANTARTEATAAMTTTENVDDRVEALEAMNGVSPETPVDGQTASLISQAGSLTNAAVGSVAVPRVTTAAQETATLGPELITSTGWSFGEGWSGDFVSGFTKVPGNESTLRWVPPFSTGTNLYLVEWKWDGSATHQDVYSGYDVYFGGGYAGITYQGAAPANASYSRAVRSLIDGQLDFMPWTNFEGRIHSISVRQVTAAATVGVGWRSSDGYRVGEMRFGKSGTVNLFLGLDSGKWNYTGHRNAAVGSYAMSDNVSGFFNSALGYYALKANISGTRNVAVGYSALAQNTAGDRNVGIGPFALTRNTTGQRNVAVGVDVLWRNETGSDNIGIGYLTQTELRTGFSNIAIGRYAMQHTHGATQGGTKYNIAIGEESLTRVIGEGNVAIGRRAATGHTGANIVAIGARALESSTTAGSQTAVGFSALQHFTGGRNTALGNAALQGVSGASTGERNVAVGDNSGTAVTTGSMNTILGPSAGGSITSGSRNIVIGYGASGLVGADDFLNIGAAIYGDLATKRIGINVQVPTATLHLRSSTGAAGTAPMKLNTGTLLATPEVGALEFAGGKLYFTPSTGVRREIAFVTPEPEPEPTP